MCVLLVSTLLLLLLPPPCLAFLPNFNVRLSSPPFARPSSAPRLSSQTTRLFLSNATTSAVPTDAPATDARDDPLGLTRELRKLTDAFESIGDDKLRYKQLLYMAGQLAPMDDALKTMENKVPGCLSTVHVHATLDSTTEPSTIRYSGDSDGLLTKGLVALLVRGLSGNTAQQIQTVDPTFIQQAGISASLTPGRNNGFLNMLAVMKRQALQLEQEAMPSASSTAEDSSSTAPAAPASTKSGRPRYDAMMEALRRELQPAQLELVDRSHEHAGHAGNNSKDGESHFDLVVVSESFHGLNLIKRHKLVYQVLKDSMPHIHALQIRAQTPSEAGL
jgi:sulfur transfer protein SufE/stress-induced morphogen